MRSKVPFAARKSRACAIVLLLLAHSRAETPPQSQPPTGLQGVTAPTTINVEVDYMVAADHSHIFNPDEVAAVVGMFACQGITINIVVSDSIPETPVLETFPGGVFANDNPGQYLDIKNTYFNHNGQPGWHYCVFGHQYDLGAGPSGSSGLGEIFGDDFIVTLGAFVNQIGVPFDRSGTFAHELGHNLGLTHAGSQSEGTVTQYKPNYPSVMSYRYQLRGVRFSMQCWGITDTCRLADFKNLDYSHGTLPSIDESALDERVGIGAGAVDWNCNGVIDATPVAHELGTNNNGGSTRDWCLATGLPSVLLDYDDWSNITDVTFLSSTNALRNRPTISCITADEALSPALSEAGVWPPLCFNDRPPVAVEPCSYPFADADADSVSDACDNCPIIANTNQVDSDSDSFADACDVCPQIPDPAQVDTDQDGAGDACDQCPLVPAPCCCTVAADADQSADVTIGDATFIIVYVFNSGPPPFCYDQADADGSNELTISDVVYIIDYIFQSGPGPVCGTTGL